jgi:hypothetical protein
LISTKGGLNNKQITLRGEVIKKKGTMGHKKEQMKGMS